MIPCIDTKSIGYLYGTADERYNFSKEFFRKTHYPQSLNRYFKNKLIENVSETELLEELLESHPEGNRVFIIFGSTGSGKSELLCWLRDQWEMINNPRPVIRISRSELNPQLLVKKCYESIGVELEELIIDEDKWNLLINKPITIINQIVWATMSELFESDEDIVPATMLLRPVIEKNILEFTKQIKNGEIKRPLEVITKSQFDSLKESTSLSINLNYYKFRDSLLNKLDKFLFQGTDIKTIFKKFSKILKETQIRPVLLIDDLVQSINLYSSDLLDYFITLEEGNWDVVIGLTPGAEHGHEFNIELMNRIKTLDTIDDRVKKLWLSDESGTNFFTLAKDQAEKYIQNYLLALKEANGFKCSIKCPHANACSRLFDNSNQEFELLPFNMPLISRIYDGIPDGKGKLRYLILHSREILRFIIKGNSKGTKKISRLVNREVFVDHPNELFKLLGELYASNNTNNFVLTKQLLAHFKYEIDNQLLYVSKVQLQIEEQQEDIIKKSNNNVINQHIRDWVEGQNIKEQLLEPVRSGVATIIHEVVKGTSIIRGNTSRMVKSTPTIQRTEVVNRFRYPIGFSDSVYPQLKIERKINLLRVADFQQLKMQDRGTNFSQIANDYNIADWIFETERIKKQWISELENNLGYSMAEFSYFLKKLLLKITTISQSKWTNILESPIKREWIDVTEELFLDWFALRDNMIDFNALEKMKNEDEFDRHFLSFVPSKTLNKFHINNYPLQTFILDMQNAITYYLESLIVLLNKKISDLQEYRKFQHFLTSDFIKYINKTSDFAEKTNLTIKELILVGDIINWFEKEENNEVISRIEKEQILLNRLNLFLPLLNPAESDNFRLLSIGELEDYLKNNMQVRQYVRKHILNIVENGETQLPRKQWKGILRDIERVNPELFDLVNLKMNIRN